MKAIGGRGVAVAAACALAAAVAMGGPDPTSAPEPAPAPAPAPASETTSDSLKIVELKLATEQLRLDAVKAQGSAKSQKEKDEIGVIIQSLDAIYSRLEHMLDNA